VNFYHRQLHSAGFSGSLNERYGARERAATA
jgi:hypothetical protein